jgi:hypothetical protein
VFIKAEFIVYPTALNILSNVVLTNTDGRQSDTGGGVP